MQAINFLLKFQAKQQRIVKNLSKYFIFKLKRLLALTQSCTKWIIFIFENRNNQKNCIRKQYPCNKVQKYRKIHQLLMKKDIGSRLNGEDSFINDSIVVETAFFIARIMGSKMRINNTQGTAIQWKPHRHTTFVALKIIDKKVACTNIHNKNK